MSNWIGLNTTLYIRGLGCAPCVAPRDSTAACGPCPNLLCITRKDSVYILRRRAIGVGARFRCCTIPLLYDSAAARHIYCTALFLRNSADSAAARLRSCTPLLLHDSATARPPCISTLLLYTSATALLFCCTPMLLRNSSVAGLHICRTALLCDSAV